MFKMAERSDGCSGETFLASCVRKKNLQRKMANDYYWIGVQENVGMFNIKIPKGIPSRCEGLVKSYSNGELTFKDYMKQMGKCKRAEQVFNMMALGVTDKNFILRNSIAGAGPGLKLQAYKYAMQRMRNYVPSKKEAAQADAILDKWRSNSFGNRNGNARNQIPDAIKKFMTGQFVETTADKKAKIQAQTASALESAKSMILKSVTGKLNDVPNNFLNSATYKKSGSPLPNLNSIPQLPQLGKLQGQKKNQFIVASGNQPMAQLVAAAHAILAATGQSPPAVGAALAKKATIPSLLGKTTAAIQQTQKMNLLESSVPAGSPQSFIATVPNVISKSSSVTNNLLAALQSMSSGPESPAFPPMTVLTSSRKRSLPPETLNQFHKLIKKIYKRRVARDAKDSADKYSGKAIERSKMDMPPSDTQQAPKLMDKIRDMSSVIASP